MIGKYRVRNGMTIYDVALQLYGDTSKVRKIMKDNNISLSQDLNNIEIQYEITNTTLPNYFLDKNIIISTGKSKTVEESNGAFSNGFSSGFKI
jgi:hypothetical protein